MHSTYALGLGVGVMLLASKGFAHARWLTISLGAVWVILMVFFRIYGSGTHRVPLDATATKLRFFVMTYVLKNMYQGMLFFLLPFYWRSATWGSSNQWFVVALGICAFLATLDVVFDHILMRWKVAASLFYLFTLFAATNLVIPALLPRTPVHGSLLAAAAVAHVAFWTLHMRPAALFRPLPLVGLLLTGAAATFGVHSARRFIPPASLWVEHGGIGPSLLPDGRLAIEASRMHVDVVAELHCVADVAAPAGLGDALTHVWRHAGVEVYRREDLPPEASGHQGIVRTRSNLLPAEVTLTPAGPWTVDILTPQGQLVGRLGFEVLAGPGPQKPRAERLADQEQHGT